MRTIQSALIILFLLPAAASAHSGDTDSCGGHVDHKSGGYHIHNYYKYCNCHPDYVTCKRLQDKMKKEEEPLEKDSQVEEDGAGRENAEKGK